MTFGVPVHHIHGATLHDARNDGLAAVDTEYVVFLDGDDELEPGYLDRMAGQTADLVAPSVRYVRHHWTGGTAYIPRVSGHDHDCSGECLPDGNWLVIGARARAATLRAVGGFRDWPMYEDWDLWLRVHLHGGTIDRCPAAVYKAWVRARSRNRDHAPERCARVHSAIAVANGLPALPGFDTATVP